MLTKHEIDILIRQAIITRTASSQEAKDLIEYVETIVNKYSAMAYSDGFDTGFDDGELGIAR